MVSQDTLNALVSREVPPDNYMFRLKEGVDAKATAKALEAAFLEHGMQGVVIADEIRETASANRMMNTLLEGFMGLGLVVGIAALGVIAARSVVERRQQIGILRALGFQGRMVQLTFLIESSFIALLGILIGVVLGAFLAYNLIAEVSQEIEGLAYRVPWLNLLVVVVIAYGASLLTTFLPARQAARVYPAEALRFE
jgi:putative ABC transport system permease protein